MDINLKKTRLNGLRNLVKKYGYYGLLALSVAALVLVILVTTPAGDQGGDINVGAGQVVFSEPVLNASVLKAYSGDELSYNATLNQWQTHKAIDFVAADGTNVLAVYDGTVEAIYTNYMEGTVVLIDHGGELKTLYSSLDSALQVEEGDVVEKGDIVGTASSSAMNEASDGSHLHFEVWEDGTKVDPSAYLNSVDK
jgi:murein DD-endopeptidase MepM/ murein hydrolase activator NlpD